MATHLALHDGLLKARSNHGLLARLLVCSPGGSAVRGLHAADTLPNLGRLLQGAIMTSERVSGCGIGAGDSRRLLPRGRVVGDGAVGQTRHGGRVGAHSEGADRRKGRNSAATGHHAGQIGYLVWREGKDGWQGATLKSLNNPRGVVWWVSTAFFF